MPFKGVESMRDVDHPNPATWKYCRDYTFPREGIAINRIAIERVDFADGTTWVAPAAPSPSPG